MIQLQHITSAAAFCHIRWDKIGSKEKFGGLVVSVISVEQPTKGTATKIVISVQNCVVRVWHFQCEIGFPR